MEILDEALWVRFHARKVHQGKPILEPEFKGRVLELHQKTGLHGKFSSKRQRGWEAGKSLVAATYREAAGGGGRPNIRLAKGVGRKKNKRKKQIDEQIPQTD